MGHFINRRDRGEITAVFATISLLAIMIASAMGLRATQDIRKKAAGCSYYSNASVVKTDGSSLRTSENGNKSMSIRNDLYYRERLDSNGMFSFGTQTFNFGAYKKPSTTATVTLENLDPSLWKVKSTFCTQQPGSSVGCDLGAKGIGSTKLTMQYFHINCGVNIAYGWVVEPVMGVPVTTNPIPTINVLPISPTSTKDYRLPQDRVTPTVSIFSSPTPTLSIYRGYLCNTRCNPNGGVGKTSFGQSELPSTCASGYTCVNTCAQGEVGCAPSNRGVCRAVSCPNDTSCGCVKPLIPTLAPFEPTSKPIAQPTVAPLAPPCFYDSKISVVDTSGKNLSVTSLEGRQSQWSIVNGSGGTVQFDSHYGSMSPLKWGFDTVSPNKKSDGLVQTSAFIPAYVPNPSTNTSSLTLRTDPTYEVVQKKIVRHCQREFDQLNGVVRGCSDVNNQGQLRGSYTGIVTAGGPNEIPNVALLCNMHVDAQYVVRKKPTGTARVNVQLSAGDDLGKNIPFLTEQIKAGLHLYDGRSTVTFTGNSSGNAGFTKTVVVTQPTVDIALPVGGYTVSYNFPSGVLPVREKNDGYRLNSPPIDGTQITVTEGNVYTYRVIYNMNTYYCKGTRNKTSCESCNGGKVDEVTNGAWPNPNGKTLCCPTNKGEIKPGDFNCPNNYDSRCTPGSTYYGNCGHTDPASGKVCPKGQRAKYICQANNANNFWSYQGCVVSPSGMDRCIEPTPTTAPVPTAGPRAPGVPTPTLPYPIECENQALFTRSGTSTQSEKPPKECPTAFFGGTINVINPHGLPLDDAKIELTYTNPLDNKLGLHKKNMKGLKNGLNTFRVYRDNDNELIKFGTKYYVHAVDIFIGHYYFKSNESIGKYEVTTPSNEIEFTLDLSGYIGAGLKSVMLLTVDPKLSSGKSVFEEYGFDTRSASRMAITTLEKLQEFSGGLATYSITDTVTYSKFPPQLSTSPILESQVRQCYDNYYVNDCKCGSNLSCTSSCKSGLAGKHCENPGQLCRTCRTDLAVDYNKLFSELDICKKINEEVDAVVVVTFPYSGFTESASVGPNPGAANGARVINTECKKNVTVLAIDASRQAPVEDKFSGEVGALHSFGHHVEAIMREVYKDHPKSEKSNWDLFTLSDETQKGTQITGCGTIHYAPNSVTDYDHSNTERKQKTYCKAFESYPIINTNITETVDCNKWNCSRLDYFKQWFNSIPNKEGVGPDGKFNNWWKYINGDQSPQSVSIQEQQSSKPKTRYHIHTLGETIYYDQNHKVIKATVNTVKKPNFTCGNNVCEKFLLEDVKNCPTDCSRLNPKDFNTDYVINSADYSQLFHQFGQNGIGLKADINHDNTVNALDLSIFMYALGDVGR